jgi:hypothetical protein
MQVYRREDDEWKLALRHGDPGRGNPAVEHLRAEMPTAQRATYRPDRLTYAACPKGRMSTLEQPYPGVAGTP